MYFDLSAHADTNNLVKNILAKNIRAKNILYKNIQVGIVLDATHLLVENSNFSGLA